MTQELLQRALPGTKLKPEVIESVHAAAETHLERMFRSFQK